MITRGKWQSLYQYWTKQTLSKSNLEIYRVLCTDRDFNQQEDVIVLTFHVLKGTALKYIRQKSTETSRRNRQIYHRGRLLASLNYQRRQREEIGEEGQKLVKLKKI